MALRGNASTKLTRCGHLNRASRSRQCASSFASLSSWPGLSATTATPIAARVGLKVLQGIWLGNDRFKNQAQIAAAVALTKDFPDTISALVVGNEVLDAMPVHVVRARNDGVDEVGVVADSDGFAWQTRTAAGALLEAAQQLPIVPGCTTE